ncbi:MAG: sugar phosphate isomerase/epimerase [Nanoarchaeota archaeon]|nr:sugar phosphate isomerase/epimerase [Nanoarchaeota archaeon]
MDIGIKIYPEDLEYAKRIAKYCDFFEVTAIPKSNFRALKAIKRPFTVHTIHSHWGFNPADPAKKDTINRVGVETAKKAADILGAETIVVHPGYLEDKTCSIKHTISFIKRIDSRFVVENMPALGPGGKRIGGSLSEMRSILRDTRKSMCLDFPHAAEYAHHHGLDYIQFIKRLMALKPRYFHISDTRIQNRKDLHLHMKEGNLRLWYFEKLIPKGGRLLIETAHEFRKQHRDIALLRENG